MGGRANRGEGGLYDQAFVFAENQAGEEALTPIQSPRMGDDGGNDDRDIDEMIEGVPFRPIVGPPPTGDNAGDGRNYSPPKYRFNRMKR